MILQRDNLTGRMNCQDTCIMKWTNGFAFRGFKIETALHTKLEQCLRSGILCTIEQLVADLKKKVVSLS